MASRGGEAQFRPVPLGVRAGLVNLEDEIATSDDRRDRYADEPDDLLSAARRRPVPEEILAAVDVVSSSTAASIWKRSSRQPTDTDQITSFASPRQAMTAT